MKYLILAYLFVASLLGDEITKATNASFKEPVSIKIKNVPPPDQSRINGIYHMSSSGLLYLPMLKRGILVKGLNHAQIANQLEKSYIHAGIFKNPQIVVLNASDFQKPIITVGGHVKKPGLIPFKTEMTLKQSIQLAGGVTESAAHRVELYRNGKRQIYNLYQNDNQPIKLSKGDTINVPMANYPGR